MINLYDQYGKRICVGDIVTYPVRKKSDLWMSTGKVEDMYNTGLKLSDTTTGRIKHVQNIDNVTIVYHNNNSMLDDWARNKVAKVDELERVNTELIKETTDQLNIIEHMEDRLDSHTDRFDKMKEDLEYRIEDKKAVIRGLVTKVKRLKDSNKHLRDQVDSLLIGYDKVHDNAELKKSVDTLSDRVGALIDDMISFKTEEVEDIIADYESFVERTSKSDVKAQTNEDVNNPVWSGMALAAEVGEFLSIIKKGKQGKLSGAELTKAITDEGSDVLWYLTKLLLLQGSGLSKAIRFNISKLSARFNI